MAVLVAAWWVVTYAVQFVYEAVGDILSVSPPDGLDAFLKLFFIQVLCKVKYHDFEEIRREQLYGRHVCGTANICWVLWAACRFKYFGQCIV